jgi:hypothetical protein
VIFPQFSTAIPVKSILNNLEKKIMKLRKPMIVISSLVVLMLVLASGVSYAHQPYCETVDLTMKNAWQVPDTEVSYAYFGNLYPAVDVDYFTFDASENQEVLISLSIPDIEGQEGYAPVVAVFGAGLEGNVEVPDYVTTPEGQGGMLIPLGDEPEYWYEEFGGQYYWNWDNYFFEAPQDATYTAILWHPNQEIGRYSFVIGEREEFGGDMECMQSLGNFWTPLVEGESPYTEEAPMAMSDSHTHEDGQEHDHSKQMDMSGDSAPFVDLSVIPLGDGSYNIRVQTLNFIFAPQNVNQDPIAGEGHAHLYVDGVKIARLYGEWFHLESLPENAEMISVSLYANNHQALSVDGIEVSDMEMVADWMGDL